MSGRKDYMKKPNPPPKKDQPISKDEGKKESDDKSGGSLGWLYEADRFEPPKLPPKKYRDWKKPSDWMKEGGKKV